MQTRRADTAPDELGDPEAFTALYERHAEAVWNFAYRLTGSWSEADDALSTVFLTAWRRRRDMRLVGGSALPWLYLVTRNVCRGEGRRLARLWRALPRLVRPDVPDHADRIADEDAAGQRLATVLAAIDRLPRAEREAVHLCLLGDTSVEDAAELLGLSPHSVRSRLYRARTRLQQNLPEDHDA
ncbi:RNA polymerase sigma factor [Actinoplanes couchii]|uniref:DNA-directed RNA polymerase sigma-70 factor n=1 Tax=Actinoplanes couchii TaxID=403638 RepID=A0ABQ3XTR9_9ACTN|nr:sigma-70 family RNA polymerase sigma factor [Actinoplanes couchii]MDR6319028.1 RNA polymerase sigma-70 factor (ECF subfamily) [Actinoplanes couchii]GID61903.1 DNA-directed RNA polymerase sigma-70 factor [Actinoplanes couchii]